MLKKHVTSLKTFENIHFSIRRMQKMVGAQRFRQPIRRIQRKSHCTATAELRTYKINLLGKSYSAFALTIVTFQRFKIKNVKKAFNFPKNI